MADIGGYTGVPDTLPEAQAEIVRLLDEQKRSVRSEGERLRVLNGAVAMIQAAREALNAVEKPAAE